MASPKQHASVSFRLWHPIRVLYERVALFLKSPWFKGAWPRKTPSADGKPSFMRLPVDVVLLIVDELPLDAKVLLSSSCRSMRTLLRPTCISAVRDMSFAERRMFLANLAANLPSAVMCMNCDKIHGIDIRDVPDTRIRGYQCCKSADHWIDLHDTGPGYKITHKHVQIGAKYARFGANTEHLAALIAPYSAADKTDNKLLRFEYFAQSKVVDRRFLVLSRWRYAPIRDPVSEQTLPTCITFCPHLETDLPSSPTPVFINAISLALRSLIQNPGTQVRGGCDRCLTDYAMEFSYDGTLSISFWRDFGDGSSLPSADPSWGAHISSTTLTVSHEPGSIRSRYDKSE